VTAWLAGIGTIYLAALVGATWFARRKTLDDDDYVLAGSNIGALLGCLTFGATLFSTFTLLGMPDFFRTHGVGAWIFLGVADAAVAFVILWYAQYLRRRAAGGRFRGIAGLLGERYASRWAGYLYFAGVFIFLVPYVAIQIRGIGFFLNAAFPEILPTWGWSLLIVVALVVYSEVGGLKAIIYSDAMQGMVLLAVTWVIAYTCIDRLGGIRQMFVKVAQAEPALLSTPGPAGLFDFQFLIASFFAICVLPITQPQLATRLVIMNDLRATRLMAVAVGIFSMLVILPTIAIGFYGAVMHPLAATPEFLVNTLLNEQANVVGATVAVGLIAAAMSTADSQLFALGTELRSLMHGDDRRIMRFTRWSIGGFAAAAFAFAVLSSNQLVLLARLSFAGTALLAPMILTAMLTESPRAGVVLPLTAAALILFLASLAGLVPERIAGVRLEFGLLLGLAAIAAIDSWLCAKQ